MFSRSDGCPDSPAVFSQGGRVATAPRRCGGAPVATAAPRRFGGAPRTSSRRDLCRRGETSCCATGVRPAAPGDGLGTRERTRLRQSIIWEQGSPRRTAPRQTVWEAGVATELFPHTTPRKPANYLLKGPRRRTSPRLRPTDPRLAEARGSFLRFWGATTERTSSPRRWLPRRQTVWEVDPRQSTHLFP